MSDSNRVPLHQRAEKTIPPAGAKRWIGPPPETCDIGGCPIVDEFIDGATKMGPWANMCPNHFRSAGVGLGTGRGQRYRRSESTPGVVVWLKVEG